MSIDSITSDIESALRGQLLDQAGEPAGVVMLYTLGEIYIRYPDGQHYQLTVVPVAAETVDFLDEEDWQP